MKYPAKKIKMGHSATDNNINIFEKWKIISEKYGYYGNKNINNCVKDRFFQLFYLDTESLWVTTLRV